MVVEFKGEALATLGWKWVQGATDDERLRFSHRIVNQIADELTKGVWHRENEIILSTENKLWDLARLPREIFRGQHLTEFISVEALLIVSSFDSVGQLIVGAAPYDCWWEPFASEDDTVEVNPNSCMMLTNSAEGGWPILADEASSSSGEGGMDRMLKLTAIGGDVTYSIAVIGELTDLSDSSSSSG